MDELDKSMEPEIAEQSPQTEQENQATPVDNPRNELTKILTILKKLKFFLPLSLILPIALAALNCVVQLRYRHWVYLVFYVLWGAFFLVGAAANIFSTIEKKDANGKIKAKSFLTVIIVTVLTVALIAGCVFMSGSYSDLCGKIFWYRLIDTSDRNTDNLVIELNFFAPDKLRMDYIAFEYNALLGMKLPNRSESTGHTYPYSYNGTLVVNSNRYSVKFLKDGSATFSVSLRLKPSADYLAILLGELDRCEMELWHYAPYSRWDYLYDLVHGNID